MAVFYSNIALPTNNNASIATFATANEGKLVLPSTGLLVEYDGTVNFIKLGYSSSLSITSGVDLTGITFTIYGINNGYYITETIAGPNNTTVSTNNMFEKIISVSISANIANQFTLGSGRDVVVISSIDKIPSIVNSRPAFVVLLNAPAAPAGGLAVNSAFLFNILTQSKILLDKTKLNGNAGRPINYELVQNGLTQAQLTAGFNVALSAGGLQCVFVVTNGALTFPVAYSVTWVSVV